MNGQVPITKDQYCHERVQMKIRKLKPDKLRFQKKRKITVSPGQISSRRHRDRDSDRSITNVNSPKKSPRIFKDLGKEPYSADH